LITMTAERFLRRWSVIGLLGALLMLVFPAQVLSQGVETEEPTSDGLIAATSTASSPTADATAGRSLPPNVAEATVDWATVVTLRSAFTFAVPLESITEAALTIEQPGWSESSVGVAIDVEEFADTSTTAEDFVYLWEVDPENPPNLFFNTIVTWTFTFDDETTVDVVDRLYYADPRSEWTAVYIRPEALLVVVPSNRYPSTSLRIQLEPVVDLLEANTGQTPQLNAVAFDPRLSLNPCQTNAEGVLITVAPQSRIEVPCDAEAIAAVYTANNFMTLELPSADVSAALNAVTSQLFASVYEPLWEESESDIPLWFQAGLERYYWPTPKIDLLAVNQQAIRTGGVIRDMDSPPSDANRDPWLAQSYGMVLYLSDQIGVDGLFELAARITGGEDFAAVYEELVGSDLSGLIPAWSNWVLTRAAEGAYTFYPYLPPTPTATASPSRTPTFTPTSTITLTPSLTPSVTGELSPTPSQTPPPSDTPTLTPSETFTVTPRSMQSLFTPTPVPPDPNAENTANFLSALSLGLIGLGVLLLISVLAYGFFQRNRS
jgi:hypothetical protein